MDLPPSLVTFFGGGGGTTVGGIVAGSGAVAKVAAMVAAGVIAGGVGHEAVDAVAADEPARTQLPELKRVPKAFPKLYGTTVAAAGAEGATPADDAAAPSFGPVEVSTVRVAVTDALSGRTPGAHSSESRVG